MDDRNTPRTEGPEDARPGADRSGAVHEEEDWELEDETADRPSDETTVMPARGGAHGEGYGQPPPTVRARISGVEAGVAAGLTQPGDESTVPPASGQGTEEDPEAAESDSGRRGRGGAHFRQRSGARAAESTSSPVQLPDWTDPPTREVPRAVLGPSAPAPQHVPGPVWREDDADWDLDSLAFAELVNEGASVPEHGRQDEDDDLDLGDPRTRVLPTSEAPVTGRPTASGGTFPKPTAGSFPRPSDTASSIGAGRPGVPGQEGPDDETGGAPQGRVQQARTGRLRLPFGRARATTSPPEAADETVARAPSSGAAAGADDLGEPRPPSSRQGRARSFTVAEQGTPAAPSPADAGGPPPAGEPVAEAGPGPWGEMPADHPGALNPTVAVPPEGPVPPRGRVKFAGRAARPDKDDEPVAEAPPARPGAAVSPAGAAGAAATSAGGDVGGAPNEPFDVDRVEPVGPAGGRRSPVLATVTGLAVGGVTLLCFLAGGAAVLALACLALTIAIAECYQAFRRAHYRPAALLGLLATPGAAVAAYERGPQGILLVAALLVVLAFCWYVLGLTRVRPVQNLSVTVLGWLWIGGLGAFAGLLLSPGPFPARHGLAYLLGAIEATVAYDVGGYLFGSLLGRHKLAPFVSPNKTWEGLVGGSVCALVVALAITSQMAPWTLLHAAELGVVVAIVAPFGDLAESMVKRDLRLKDMGTLLPHHGGLLDRVDALLFVLPATYFLARAFH